MYTGSYVSRYTLNGYIEYILIYMTLYISTYWIHESMCTALLLNVPVHTAIPFNRFEYVFVCVQTCMHVLCMHACMHVIQYQLECEKQIL